MSLYNFLRPAAWVFLRLKYRLRYEGRENIPEKGSYLLVCNHRTLTDPIIIASGIKQELHFIAKAEIYKNKLLSAFFTAMGAYKLKRGEGDTGVIDWARDHLENERCVAIFPEGTRSKTGELLKIKSGAAYIALRSNARILPCALNFYGKTGWGSKVVVRFGKIIEPDEFELSSPRAIRPITRRISAEIASLMDDTASLSGKPLSEKKERSGSD
ncbi:MAG: 1-acyl-sn-glycerol-3-phosphate acyltransferase [Synergistes sp.]|nr:1-acyl-sn-glycerol-3-phosphate acyltransferase [Synergistes sp.]